MITCPNCKKELEDGTKFCDNCGKQIVETIFCHNCGKQTSTEFAFCQNCGTSLTAEAVTSDSDRKKKPDLTKFTAKISKKVMAIGAAGIALILIVAILLGIILTPKNSNNIALYLKDDEMYLTDMSKIEPWQVTTRLLDGADTDDDDDVALVCGYFTYLTSDGKTLFYIDKITEDSDGATLFCRSAKNPKKEPIKIDSDVRSYSVSENGKLVTYLKAGEGNLYQHDLTDKEKIAGDVSWFIASEDGKKIIYLNDDSELYMKESGKDKEKIDSDVSSLAYVSEKLDTVYYMKDGSFYKRSAGKDKVKIASDVSSVVSVYDSGEAYYLKLDSDEIKLMDYVTDDMKATDEAMTEPICPDYPSYWSYDSSDAYQAALAQYELEYNSYTAARDAWREKQNRDSLRNSLAEKTIEKTVYTLCYYDDDEETVLTDALSATQNVAEEAPVIIFSVYNQSSVDKVKLSEIRSVSDVESMVTAALYSATEKYIAIEEDMTVIEQTDAQRFLIAPDGKAVYFLDDISEESATGDLYRMTVSGDKAQKPEIYDTDVYAARLLKNGKIAYFKDVKNSKGDLYVEKQRIDYDVYLYNNFNYVEETDTLVYLTDWNEEKEYGTLKTSKNNKATKIADDVHSFTTMPNGEILYLQDYSTTHRDGELYLFKKKAVKIDDDVSYIIPMNLTAEYRGTGYHGR